MWFSETRVPLREVLEKIPPHAGVSPLPSAIRDEFIANSVAAVGAMLRSGTDVGIHRGAAYWLLAVVDLLEETKAHWDAFPTTDKARLPDKARRVYGRPPDVDITVKGCSLDKLTDFFGPNANRLNRLGTSEETMFRYKQIRPPGSVAEIGVWELVTLGKGGKDTRQHMKLDIARLSGGDAKSGSAINLERLMLMLKLDKGEPVVKVDGSALVQGLTVDSGYWIGNPGQCAIDAITILRIATHKNFSKIMTSAPEVAHIFAQHLSPALFHDFNDNDRVKLINYLSRKLYGVAVVSDSLAVLLASMLDMETVRGLGEEIGKVLESKGLVGGFSVIRLLTEKPVRLPRKSEKVLSGLDKKESELRTALEGGSINPEGYQRERLKAFYEALQELLITVDPRIIPPTSREQVASYHFLPDKLELLLKRAVKTSRQDKKWPFGRI